MYVCMYKYGAPHAMDVHIAQQGGSIIQCLCCKTSKRHPPAYLIHLKPTQLCITLMSTSSIRHMYHMKRELCVWALAM